ncbi:MAG: hypothetical protein KAT77_06145 [Nanoarchaeota archaeon]|nr:hypothetical protein [Nanoarchaeota archaeon]
MLEFTRVLTKNQIKVLDALDKLNSHQGDRCFSRRSGKNLPRKIQYLNTMSQYYQKQDYPRVSYQKATLALQNLERFLKDKTSLKPLINSIEDFLEAIGRERECQDDLNSLVGIFESIQRHQPQLNQKKLQEKIKTLLKPHYWNFEYHHQIPSSKVEGVVKNLYGIISVDGDEHRYHDIFIPEHVFEKIVRPALDDSSHQINIKVEDNLALDIFNYIYARTLELSKKYGNYKRFRFTRPEICREINIKMPKRHKFNDIMKPLEGILGRIQDQESFYPGTKKSSGSKYCLYYQQSSWFLPLKHQRIIEAEKH